MAVNYYQRVERTTNQIIDDFLREEPTYIFSGFPANIGVGISAVEAYANTIAEPEHAWRGDILRKILRDVATGRNPAFRFAENPRYRETLNTVYERYDKQRCAAGDNIIIHNCLAAGIPLDDTQSVLDLCAEQQILDSLPDSPEHTAQKEYNTGRERMINFITKNGTSGFSLTNEYGTNKRQFDKDGFEIQFSSSGGRGPKGTSLFDDDTSLRNAYNQIVAKRQAIELYNEGKLGKHVDQQAKQRFEDRFHSDPTTGAPVTTSTKPLIDPRDGSIFSSKKQLVSFINSSRYATAQLLQRNGKVDPELAREFERILNGHS